MSAKYTIVPLAETNVQPKKWNDFVEHSNGGTIFHRLDFLSYHGDRFSENECHLVILKGEELFGVMPLGLFEEHGRKIAKSPYGASYGGPVFKTRLSYSESSAIISAILTLLENMDVTKLTITLPIAPAYSDYCETFRFCLYEQGFKATNRDISSVARIGDNKEEMESMFDSRGRNMLRKAQKLGVEVECNVDLEVFWPVLLKTYDKLGIHPTHSQEEMDNLVKIFPERVYFDIAKHEQRVISGIAYFVINKRINSSFYLANDPDYQALQGQSLLVGQALVKAAEMQFEFFDFGTSSVGMKARDNLFRFKESFGSMGYFRDTFTWEGQ